MKKVGILGGGQLGRMLLQAAANYPVETFVMEQDINCPAAHLCHHFTKGDITNYDDVLNFGIGLDAMTIEIERVNVEALYELQKRGVQIIPKPDSIDLIRNKIRQKEYYASHRIPTSPFVITQNQNDLSLHAALFPAVHKLAEGGYDGKGVQVLNDISEINKGFDQPSVLEKKVDIDKELAVLVAVDHELEMTTYPVVEMVFDPQYNLLSHQLSPATLPDEQLWKATQIAMACVKPLASAGLFAVELFVDQQGEIFVNEMAPRVHNSGHHTIEGNYSSQFDMLWRILLEYPLGNTEPIMPTALVNVFGGESGTGEPYYEGLHEVLSMENVFVHLYGKNKTAPGRKMGHITILSSDYLELLEKVEAIKNCFEVKAV
jgi:5-(carboxyamino)imidazole ribonucleotide synthase